MKALAPGRSSISPAGWRTIEFDQFTTLKRGQDLTRDQFRDGTVPVAGSNGVIGFHDAHNVTGPGVTVGRSGSVGRVTFYKSNFWAHNTALYVSDFHGNDPLFAGYFLRYLGLERYRSGASVPTLDRNAFRQLPVTVPDAPEQRKIADLLKHVQQQIEQHERLASLMAELKSAVRQKFFTRGLSNEPQKKTDLGLAPESWRTTKVRDIAKLKAGGTPSRSTKAYWEHGTIPWVKTGEVDYCTITSTEEHITQLGLENSSARLFPAGTLLMAMYGQGITRGRVAMLGMEAATNQACVAFFPSENVRSKFLYYYFEHHYEALRGYGHGANQKNLSADILKGMPVSFPDSKSEQDTIVDCLEALDNKATVIKKRTASLNDLFKTLLHQLMCGHLRATDPQQVAAE